MLKFSDMRKLLSVLDKILGFDDMGSGTAAKPHTVAEQPVVRSSFPEKPSKRVRETLPKIDDLDPNKPKAQVEPAQKVEEPKVRYSLSWDEDALLFDRWVASHRWATFQQTLLYLIEQKRLSPPEFYNAAFMDRKLFSAIKNNENYRPSKETAVACCFGLGLSLHQSEKLLRTAGYSLSLSIPWDRVVYYCLEHGIKDLNDVNELLYYSGEKCIGVKL